MLSQLAAAGKLQVSSALSSGGLIGVPEQTSLPASSHMANPYVNFDATRNLISRPIFIWWADSTGTQGQTFTYTATRQ